MEHLEKRWGSERVIWRVKGGEEEFVGRWRGVRLRVSDAYITGDLVKSGLKIEGFWDFFEGFQEVFWGSDSVSVYRSTAYVIGQYWRIWKPAGCWWIRREFWAMICKLLIII